MWGEIFIRLVVVGDATTKVTKAYGETASMTDIKEKDIIDVEGALASGGSSLVINALSIRDANLVVAGKTLSGVVTATNAASSTITVVDPTLGKTTVIASNASITKGVRPIQFADTKVGDVVLSAVGSYDYEKKTFTATSISIFQDASIFTARNFEGKLKSVSSTVLPSVLVVTIGATDYSVYVDEKGTVLNSARKPASLSRFVAGDTVRFFGAIRSTNLTEVDAEVLRDLNF